MQERYLGDIHDYFKFLFLKFLSSKLNMKIGLNWYLVDPNKIGPSEIRKNDGEKRNFFFNEELKNYDKTLIKEFQMFRIKKFRKIDFFTKNTHLDSYINFFNEFLDVNNRENWLMRSLKKHSQEKIIFLDPDNGFVKEKKGKRSLKYLLPGECKTLLSQDKVIIFSQFQSFTKKTSIHIKEILKSLEDCGLKTSIPIIRNRTSPNTFFITIKPKNSKIKLKRIFENYEKQNSRVELL